MICAFTGHRPHKLPWGKREEAPRCIALKTMLKHKTEEVIDLGCRTFLCGMAQGCDSCFAETVLNLRCSFPYMKLTAVIPWAGQAKVLISVYDGSSGSTGSTVH